MKVDKKSLRSTYLKERKALSPEEFTSRNKSVLKYFKDFVKSHDGKTYHCFLPIAKNAEVDTWPLIDFLQESQKKVVISKSDLETNILTNYYFESKEQLVINKWGIPEPVDGELALSESIDVVLIPLIVFDEKGHRIGYGKGYYDRFLENCRSDTLKLGLSLLPAIKEIPEIAPHDVPMDYCISYLGLKGFSD